MAIKKRIKNQLCNASTVLMYQRQFTDLAQNVFIFDNMPEMIDVRYINAVLVREGAIAFFYDDALDSVIALPFSMVGTPDIYGRPKKIRVYSVNGTYNRELNEGEFIIMYDNNRYISLLSDILQYSERIGQIQRTIDINISQQRTPRFWKCSNNDLKSVQDIINNVDSYENTVLSYDSLSTGDIECVLEPAPFVADKLEDSKDKLFNEFLRLIGVANISYHKKERNISDEIQAMQGGTIASRFTRFEPRKKAIEQINNKWGLDIKVRYYDGIPSNIEDEEEIIRDWKELEENSEDINEVEEVSENG